MTAIPFVIIGKKKMDCTHGVDSYISIKKRMLEERIKKDRTILNYYPVKERVEWHAVV